MNISRKQKEENNLLIMELTFALIYHLKHTYTYAKIFLQPLFHGPATEEKKVLKNYWLQKKETKTQEKEHNQKLDEIARFVYKYINNRKSSKR